MHEIGLGVSDAIELLILTPPLVFLLLGTKLEPKIRALAKRPLYCFAVLAITPIALRLALLSQHPVPTPQLYDEYTHLLVADTLRHFRLANPPHAFHNFFETFFVLQEPSYAAIYPIGQGLVLAIGKAIFGTPWAGVLLSVSALCALTGWMLRAWTAPVGALAGGLLAVTLFGPLSQWTNTYWGGAISACAGCLVFGALPRLTARYRTRDALLLGLGLAIQLLTRPYESTFLLLSATAWLIAFAPSRPMLKLVPAAILFPAVAFGLTLLHNHQVTGSWITLPEVASQYRYGVPTTFTFQPSPVPHGPLTPQQDSGYLQQASFHGDQPETLERWVRRFLARTRYYRFYLPAALWLTLPLFVLRLRDRKLLWALLTILLFAAGSNFYPFFFPHYVAAIACLIILAGVVSLEQLHRISPPAAVIAGWLAVAPFTLWYATHLFENPESPLRILRFETGDVLNHGNPGRRIQVSRQLERAPGRQLVFVRYSPRHIFQDEWVYNDADIDAARIVWARDSGADENAKLQHYYPDRTAWLAQPDAVPPTLVPYRPEPPPAPTSVAPAPRKPKPVLRFEEVK